MLVYLVLKMLINELLSSTLELVWAGVVVKTYSHVVVSGLEEVCLVHGRMTRSRFRCR